MESLKLSIEDEQIGKVLYTFDATIYYEDNGEDSSDKYPSYSEITIKSVEISSDIWAYDMVWELDFQVTDSDQIKEIKESIDWEHKLDMNL